MTRGIVRARRRTSWPIREATDETERLPALVDRAVLEEGDDGAPGFAPSFCERGVPE